MITSEALPQKITAKKKVFLKSRFDDNTVISYCQALKITFFPRYNFLKPKPENIKLVDFIKYYESYLVLGGKYSLDFCKRHRYAIDTKKQIEEIYIAGTKFKPQTQAKTNSKVINIIGEEHSHNEMETFFILDRMMNEVSPDKIPFAPYEKMLENQIDSKQDEKDEQTSLEAEIDFLQSRLVKRPPDVDIIRENFEINQRLVVCCPIYRFIYRNIKNNKEVTVLIEGITGKLTFGDFNKKKIINLFQSPSFSVNEASKNLPNIYFNEKRKLLEKTSDLYKVDNILNNEEKKRKSGKKKVPPIVVDSSKCMTETATSLAIDLLESLGFKRPITPLRVLKEGETYIVELGFPNGSSKIRLNAQKKEIEEYEIQEDETESRFSFIQDKFLIILSVLFSIALFVTIGFLF